MEPPEPIPPILVLSRKKPHLILFLVVVVCSGLLVFLEGPVNTVMPGWIVHAWAGMLLGTGGVGLLAHIQKWDRERGMYIERGALNIQSAAVACYGAILPLWVPWSANLVLSLVVAIAWAGFNTWEVKLISQDLRLIAQVRETGTGKPNDSDD